MKDRTAGTTPVATSALARMYWTGRYEVKTVVGRSPGLYFALVRSLRTAARALLPGPSTRLVVEGFPRSGNSALVAALQQRQTAPIRIAHHTHLPAPVLWALRRGIPSVVLIREPTDAIVSLRALHLENAVRAGRPAQEVAVSFHSLYRGYLRFYQPLLTHRHRCLVVTFEQIVGGIDQVCDMIEETYSLGLADPCDRTLVSELGFHALPNPIRQRIKRDVQQQLAEQLQRSRRLQRVQRRAAQLYRQFLAP